MKFSFSEPSSADQQHPPLHEPPLLDSDSLHGFADACALVYVGLLFAPACSVAAGESARKRLVAPSTALEPGVLKTCLDTGCTISHTQSSLLSRSDFGSFEGSATSTLPQSRVQNLMPISTPRSAKTVSLVLQCPSLALRILRLIDEIHIERDIAWYLSYEEQ